MISQKKFDKLFSQQKYGPAQNKFELHNMLSTALSMAEPRIIIEIGTFKGGTLRFWREILLSKNGLLISVDLNDRGFIPELQEKYKEDKEIKFIIGNSVDMGTIAKVGLALEEKQADILFIDGRHDYLYVSSDVDEYKKYVRSGGLVILHDIVPHGNGPFRKFNEIKKNPEWAGYIEIFGKTNPCGIGILQKC